MSTTIPMRVESDLFEAAKSIGAVSSRSAAQQFSHWARIGRELESSPGTSQGDIQRVLAHEPGITYDSLSDKEQAIVRANWKAQIAERVSKTNFTEEFKHTRESWAAGDKEGNFVRRYASDYETEASENPELAAHVDTVDRTA